MQMHLRVLQFLVLLARVYAPTTGNGITTGCTQTASCPPGCYGTGDAICYQCGTGFYKAITGTSLCIACASNSGDSCSVCTAATSCTCKVGYTGPNGGTCMACDTGKYKDTTGSLACNDCRLGTYSGTLGATAAATCLACPANSGTTYTGVVLLSQCFCNIGYQGGNGGTCSACVAGKYKSFMGVNNIQCLLCAAGKYSAAIGLTVECNNTCPANSGQSCVACTTLSNCVCNVGYTGTNGGACSVCPSATYKNSSSVCSTCPANSGNSCAGCFTSACPCNAGYTGGNFIGPHSSTACNRFIALMTWKPSFASVSTRNNTAVGVMPTYNALGGPSGKGHVSFVRASSQYLDAGSRTFQINTNGGFTIVAVVRFTGTVGFDERVFDFGIGSANSNIYLSRQGTLWYYGLRSPGIYHVEEYVSLVNNMVVSQNTWFQVSLKYRASSREFTFTSNNIVYSRFITTAITDRTFSATYIGKSWTAGTAFLGGDVAGLFAVDEFLQDTSITAIINTMLNGDDLTNMQCNNQCNACENGKYKSSTGSALCTSCSAGMTSPVASTSSTSCAICAAGYTGPEGSCTACVAGTYKTTAGSETCLTCPGNSNSLLGSSALASCTCNVGFTGPNGGPCTACNTRYYKATTGSASCTVCPIASTSPLASTQPGNCTCNMGYTGPNGGVCTACAAGTYKDTTGSVTCTACPANSNTLSPATQLSSSCFCNMGYSGPNGGTCTECVAGTFKNMFGNNFGSCFVCPAGKYSMVVGLTVPCDLCPVNSGDSCIGCTTVSSCVCNLGFTGPNGGPCSACPAGTYETSSSTCSTCQANSGNSCNGCYTSACPCNAGYTGGNFIGPHSTTACDRFVALILTKPSFASVLTRNNVALGSAILPTYNATGGPNGKGHVSFNSTKSQYLDAGPRTFNIATNGGFTIVVIVRFKGDPLSLVRILDIGSGTPMNNIILTITGFFLRVELYNDATSRLARNLVEADVIQDTWYTLSLTYDASSLRYSIKLNDAVRNGLIQALTDRTFSATYIGRSFYTAYPYLNADIAGVFAVDEFLSQTAITEIANTMVNGVDLTNMTCQNECNACEVGKYKSADGTVSCTACPVGLTSAVGSTSSAACIAPGCNAGYTGPSGGPCAACVAGKYKGASGSAECIDCASGTYSATEAATALTTCIGCLAGTNSPAASTSSAACIRPPCNAGYTGPDDVCSSCVTGKYKDATGSAACTDCASGTYSTTTGATAATTCLACPADKTSPAASTSSAACIFPPCNAGYTGPDGICSTCAAGTYKVGTGSAACTPCVAGTYSSTPAATAAAACVACPANSGALCSACTLLSSCTCDVGYTGPDGVVCSACAAGTYKDITGSAACTNCGTGKYSSILAATTCIGCLAGKISPAASTSSAACVFPACNAGYTGPDGMCSACAAGKYKTATGSAACTDCASDTYSATSAATVATTCLACPAGQNSPVASTSSAACIFLPCNAGYTGPDGICSTCAAGTYKVGTGSAACTPCVAGTYSTIPAATAATVCLACAVNSNSPMQSSTAAACTCNAGYSGPNGGPCAPCAAGTYKPSTGPAACTSCHAFSGAVCAACSLSTLCVCTGYTGDACTACVAASAPASTSAAACVCGPGQYDASA